jgi:hypothetical protein
MYSAELGVRNCSPSHLRRLVKTTVRAGMLTPIEKVSVAKRSRTSPSWKRISTTSRSTGSKPEWCCAETFERRAHTTGRV